MSGIITIHNDNDSYAKSISGSKQSNIIDRTHGCSEGDRYLMRFAFNPTQWIVF